MPCVGQNNIVYTIQELPDLLAINSGDKFIIESYDGASLIDYDNFIIELSQTTFADVFEKHTSDINALSARTDASSISSFEVFYDQEVYAVETEVQELLGKLESYVGSLSTTYYEVKEDYTQPVNTCVAGSGAGCCLIQSL